MAPPQDSEGLAAKYNVAAMYDKHRPSTAPSPGLTSLVDKATKNGGHIFFGEPHLDGMSVKQYEMLANNPAAFKAAAANGVKHLALEMPSTMQTAADDFVGGKISKQDFRNQMDQFKPTVITGAAAETLRDDITQTVENAKNAGMKVHFADVRSGSAVASVEALLNSYPPSVHKLEGEFRGRYERDLPNMTFEEYAGKEYAKMPKAEKDQLQKDIKDHQAQKVFEFQTSRYDDTEQYRYLRDRIPMGEGIMGVVGNRHLDNTLDAKAGHKIMGVDDYLESEGHKVTTVEVHTANTLAYQKDLYKLEKIPAADPPDYTINLSNRGIQDKEGNKIGTLDKPLAEPPQAPKPKLISEIEAPAAFA